MAIIRQNDRPALRLESEQLQAPEFWSESAERLHKIERAARAVGRIEVEGGVMPWVGTAFLVTPRLALTARYTAEAITERSAIWLNFADNPADDAPRRIAVVAIERVHPFWRFSFLRLEAAVSSEPLQLAERTDLADLKGRTIAVIGYSSFDQRNEPEIQTKLFNGTFDVKRISLGEIVGTERDANDGALSLQHDASTLGGSGGAPVIDIITGHVVGMHFSGQYLKANQAACAWDARGDPQWEHLWTEAGPREAVTPIPPRLSTRPTTAKAERFFDYAEIKAIKTWLGQARINDESGLKTLFLGLSPEFMGQVPAAELIIDRLELALDYLNDTGKTWGGHPPLYYVLTNARERRQFEPDALVEMDSYLSRLDEN